MRVRTRIDKRCARPAVGRVPGQVDLPGVVLLALCFVIGSAVGCVVSELSSLEDEFSFPDAVDRNLAGFLSVFWSCAKYSLFAALLAGTVYGLFAIPLLCALRGYLLSCTVASFAASGRIFALLFIGLPALFTVPCLFLVGADAMLCSRRLFQVGASGCIPPRLDIPLPLHLAFSAGLLVIATLVQLLLVPEAVLLLT